MIREANKVKRLAWALENQDDDFDDVIWSDECTVQLENHRRFCCRKVGHAPKPKPKYASCNNIVVLSEYYITHYLISHVGQNIQ
jgi:hypothetical protein